MDIGQAINQAKQGKKIARKGWNGKGMFLYYVPTDRSCFGGAYIAEKTAQDNMVPWLASQTDLLADDWTVVD